MTEMPTILENILKRKRDVISLRQSQRTESALQEVADVQPPVRGFQQALRDAVSAGKNAVIAEIKKASPSAGVIRADFDPARIAEQYQRGGASCLSVLTDEYFFQGHDRYLGLARQACKLPVLRKDFIIDHYQVIETRAIGADAMLLIAAALEPGAMRDLYLHARELELDVLLEVHDESELEQVLQLQDLNGDLLIGINNRDLHRFITDLDISRKLAEKIPSRHLLVSESGIHSAADIATLNSCGIRAFLIGEACMRADDPGQALQQLVSAYGLDRS